MMQHNNQTYMPQTMGQTASMDWSGEITYPEQVQSMPGGMPAGGMRPMGTVMGPAAQMNGGTMSQMGGGMSTSGTPRLSDMRSGLPAEVIESPTTTQEAYLGSLKAMLSRYVGSYIVATFLVGTQSTVSWEGTLFDVGNDYLTIYQEPRDRYIVSDYYSLKFIEFYDTERRRRCEEMLGNQWNNLG